MGAMNEVLGSFSWREGCPESHVPCAVRTTGFFGRCSDESDGESPLFLLVLF